MKCLFTHSDLRNIPLGTQEWFTAQQKIIKKKQLVRQCYDSWYSLLCRDVATAPTNAKVVELGSGAGYIKEFIPEAITSDIVPGVADQVIDARCLPFADNEVKAILLTHVFHHIPDVRCFFREAQRVLIPGGVISMIECANTPLSRIFFKKIHPEPFVQEVKEWKFTEGHSMLDSNQALSWMVFERDKYIFESEFPSFVVEQKQYLPWLGYLLSGGVNLTSLVPSFLMGFARRLDTASRRYDGFGAIHWHITIRKKNEPANR